MVAVTAQQALPARERGWAVTRLRDLLVQDATYGIVKAGNFVRSGVPMLRGGDIKNGRIGRDMPHVSQAKSDEFKRTILKENDVVIALVGYPGEAAVVSADLAGSNISRAVGLLRPSQKLLPHFLCCFLNSEEGRAEFLRPSAGSAQLVVNLRDLNNLAIPLPPHAEQRAIAEALSDADSLIESLEALIEKKRAIQQGAMQELLSGQRRLEGFAGEWSNPSLGDFFTFKNGLNKEKSAFGAGTPIINYMDVFVLPHIRSNHVRGRVTLSSAERENFSVRKGDVFFTRTSETVEEIGLAAVLIDEINDAVFSGFVLRARPTSKSLDNLFTGFALRSERVRRQIVATASYTTRALTNGRLLSAVTLATPPYDEQVAIGETLSVMDAEIGELESKLTKARQIKQGMMQELLTGMVRLV
jgi:type I restriction enzyme S subunit